MDKMKCRNRELVGVCIGVAAAILTMLGLIGLSAKMFLNQTIGENGINVTIVIVMILSIILGTQIAAMYIKKRTVAHSLTVAGFLTVVLFIMAMTMEGQFEDVWISICGMIIGEAISCVICLKKLGRSVRRKRFPR